MKMEALIIFDLDDTLIDTSDVYWRAKSEFVRLLASHGWMREKSRASSSKSNSRT
jgi:FMN phosphatase YigB (HAD superfamily)